MFFNLILDITRCKHEHVSSNRHCTYYSKERILRKKENVKKTYNFYNKFLPRFLLNDFLRLKPKLSFGFLQQNHTRKMVAFVMERMPRAFWEASDVEIATVKMAIFFNMTQPLCCVTSAVPTRGLGTSYLEKLEIESETYDNYDRKKQNKQTHNTHFV